MPHCLAIASFAGLALAMPASLAAQSANEPTPPPTAASLRHASGLALEPDGRLLGIGCDYNADFRAASVAYTPALGPRAPRDMVWEFTLAAVGRGDAAQAPEPAIRRHRERTVHYVRGSLVETYDVRGEGVKQSFVFHALPPGAGDLVVRGTVQTELEPGPVTDAGTTFELAGVGGVALGAILGFDAAGREVRGSMRIVDGGIEYRLPAAWVDAATLPLVLDPLLGTTVTIAGANDDEQPDVSYDFTTGHWLVVWQRILSGSNADVRGQRFDANAALVGGTIAIESQTATFARQPRVANVNTSDAFVVVYGIAGDVFAKGVYAANGALTAELAVATGASNQINADVGGEYDSTVANGQALIAWEDATATDIYVRPVTFGAGLVAGTAQVLATGFSDGQPAVSNSGGADGRWLVVWIRQATTAADTVRGRLWLRNGSLSPTTYGMSAETTDCTTPAVDGDGANWVVAFAVREPTGSRHDIKASQIAWRAGQLERTTTVVVEGGANDDEYAPSVGWTPYSVLVGWQDEVGANNYDTYVRSLDPYGCTVCEGNFSLGITAGNETTTRISPAFASGSYGARNSGIVWLYADTSTNTWDIKFQRFRAASGGYTELGGGCGSGGKALATCARSPNALFALRLRGGPANTTVWGVVGFDELFEPCGPCTMAPNPFTGIVFAAASDFYGNFDLNAPLQAGSVGMQFLLQWASLGASCPLGIEMSSAVRVTIEG